MDDQEMVYAKTRFVIHRTLLATKFPFWLLSAMLDSIKADLMEGLYRNSLLSKEVESDATSRSVEQHNGDATQGQ